MSFNNAELMTADNLNAVKDPFCVDTDKLLTL